MNQARHFHFVGINGIGMSGIAKILHQQGHIISGCDLAQDLANVQELIQAGCKISQQHDAELCHDNSITTVVYSSDVPFQSPELIYARARGIQTIQRAAVLAEIMRSKYGIGVAGSHGKTTTSSMIGHILEQTKQDPTIIVGGVMHNLKSNARFGKSDYVVAETDESDRSHLMLPVRLGVLTSVDFEHANLYKNLDEVIETFTQFINQIPSDGKAIVCSDDLNIQTIIPQITTSYLTYGTTPDADIQATNIQMHADYSTFDLVGHRDQKNLLLGSVTLQLPSIYNVLNATAAICAALEIGIPFEKAAEAISNFQGVDRRFTYKGTMAEPAARIFDDYGHHPTEIYHSLITARRKAQEKLIVVFQPQRYTRTYHLWNDFVRILANAEIDHLVMTDIYPASEKPIENVTGQRLAQEIMKQHPKAKIYYVQYQPDLHAIQAKVLHLAKDHDLILLLGAGKVNKLAEKLLSDS